MKTAKLIVTGCLLALTTFSALGQAQQLGGTDDPARTSFQRSLAGMQVGSGVALSSTNSSQERGTPGSDTIKGNGTRIGYMLSHAAIIPNSETVTVDGSLKIRNRDYYLDASSGSLAFAESVRPNQSIRVAYRYSAEKDAQRSGIGGPTFALNFGPKTSMGVTYAYNAAPAAGGLDQLTYGLNLTTKLNEKSTMTNMAYVSSARDSGRVALNADGTRAPAPDEPKSDNMFAHQSDLQMGKLGVQVDYQDIGKDFNGFVALRQQKATPDAALNQMEKEKGLKKLGFQANYALGGDSSTGVSWSQIEDGDAGITKYGVFLKSDKFDLTAKVREIDPEFTRILDLNDSDKQEMTSEVGMKRQDYAAQFRPGNGITLDSSLSTWKHSVQDLQKRQFANKLSIAPENGPKFSISSYQESSGSSDALAKISRDTITFSHKIGGLAVSASQDTLSRQLPSADERTVQTQKFHFNTDPKLRMSMIGDWNSIKMDDGKFQDTQVLKLSAGLARNLSFNGIRSALKTEEDETVVQEVGVSGKVFGHVSLATKFGETAVDGETVGRIRELSLLPDVPRDYGMFKQTKLSISFAEVQNTSKVESQAKGANIESTVLKHKVAVGYLGSITKDGQTPIVRSFSIMSDQAKKNPLRYDLMYKINDPGVGNALLVRRYNAQWLMSSSAKLAYNYFSYREKPNGTIEPVGGERFALTMPFTKRLDFVGGWENSENYQTGLSQVTMSFGISGKVSSLAALEASYGSDRVWSSIGKTSSQTFKLKYDYQMDADHFFTFIGRYTDWSSERPEKAEQEDLKLQLDFRTLFN